MRENPGDGGQLWLPWQCSQRMCQNGTCWSPAAGLPQSGSQSAGSEERRGASRGEEETLSGQELRVPWQPGRAALRLTVGSGGQAGTAVRSQRCPPFPEGTLGLPRPLHRLEWPLVGHSPMTLDHAVFSDRRLRRHHPDVTRTPVLILHVMSFPASQGPVRIVTVSCDSNCVATGSRPPPVGNAGGWRLLRAVVRPLTSGAE